jgi:hypothetical protein
MIFHRHSHKLGATKVCCCETIPTFALQPEHFTLSQLPLTARVTLWSRHFTSSQLPLAARASRLGGQRSREARRLHRRASERERNPLEMSSHFVPCKVKARSRLCIWLCSFVPDRSTAASSMVLMRCFCIPVCTRELLDRGNFSIQMGRRKHSRYTKKYLDSNRSCNEVYYTNSLIIHVNSMLYRRNYCKKSFDLMLFLYKINSPGRPRGRSRA